MPLRAQEPQRERWLRIQTMPIRSRSRRPDRQARDQIDLRERAKIVFDCRATSAVTRNECRGPYDDRSIAAFLTSMRTRSPFNKISLPCCQAAGAHARQAGDLAHGRSMVVAANELLRLATGYATRHRHAKRAVGTHAKDVASCRRTRTNSMGNRCGYCWRGDRDWLGLFDELKKRQAELHLARS